VDGWFERAVKRKTKGKERARKLGTLLLTSSLPIFRVVFSLNELYRLLGTSEKKKTSCELDGREAKETIS
jgi:hypothetical protein